MPLRLVVYTAVFDDFDVLLDPKVQPPDVDFVCFTDDPDSVPSGWEPRRLEDDEDLTPRAKNRRVKLLPHRFFPDYEQSMYVDGNLRILGDVRALADDYLQDASLASPWHPERTCVYDEAKACMDLGKGDRDRIEVQMERYRKEGLPEDYGLTENRVLLRRHNEEEVVDAMELWWEEFQRGAERDQLSFPFVAWETGIDHEALEIDVMAPGGFFRYHPHKPDGFRGDLWAYCLRRHPDDPEARERLSSVLRTTVYYPHRAFEVLRNGGPGVLARRLSRFVSNGG